MPSKKSVLVVAAHPDDEVLGCGGTMVRLAQTGQAVHVMILGEGIRSRYSRSSQAGAKALRKLEADAREVGRLLGVSSIRFEHLPDNRFDEVPLLKIVKRVEGCLEKIRPEVIFTHHPGDLNVDHRAAFRAVLTAARPVNGCSVREIYAFEVPSSTEWAFQRFEPVFKPNVFFDISASVEKKIQGMKRYRSEARTFPHPRSPEVLRAITQRWGSVAGLPCAEAFELIRSVR